MRRQCSTLMRAAGTRQRMAICAVILPSRTNCCTGSGSSSTNARRLATQFRLRSKRRASSSIEHPRRLSISCSNQPCSSADSGSLMRSDRSSTSASASLICHTTASTVSRPSCSSAAIRLWPSMTRYLPPLSMTMMGVCGPLSASDAISRRWRAGCRTRRLSRRRSS